MILLSIHSVMASSELTPITGVFLTRGEHDSEEHPGLVLFLPEMMCNFHKYLSLNSSQCGL